MALSNFIILLSLISTLPKVLPSPIAAPSLILPSTNSSSPPSPPVPNLNFSDPQIINYRVPNTVTSLQIITGAPISSEAMSTTLTACRSSIARAMYKWGGPTHMQPDPYSFPEEYSKDPRDTRATGAVVDVYSTNARETETGGLSWLQLDAVMRGLQEAMLAKGIFREAEFTVYDGLTAKKDQGVGWLYV